MVNTQHSSPSAWVTLRIVLFAVAMVIVGVLGANRLTAAVTRNLGFHELIREITSSPDDCGQLTFAASIPLLQDAIARQPGDATTWVAVLRLKGMTDRAWIIDRLSERGSKLSATERQAIDAAKAELTPKPWVASRRWNYSRCQSAWDAWTRGLIEAQVGNWHAAAAAYQAGIGLALGRVPDPIVKEYYSALANDWLSRSKVEPDQKLAAAKYLALSGDSQRAADLFRSLTTESRLMPEQRCEAESGLTWLHADDATTIPPWPITTVPDGRCVDVLAPSQSPEWQLAPNKALTDGNHGAALIGFDLDHDVLDAGVEVIGTLYWRSPDGSIKPQHFRQPDLWPNSGNSWLPLGEIWACLPGYIEPSWVTPCASRVVTETLAGHMPLMVGYLYEPPGDGPDSFITTPTMPVPAGQWLVYGGYWRIDGDFPRPHVARNILGVLAPNHYEVVLGLSGGRSGQWQKHVTVVPPESTEVEVDDWLRPRSGQGSGEVWFDDVFSFALPKLTP